jgi:hypothetical protein
MGSPPLTPLTQQQLAERIDLLAALAEAQRDAIAAAQTAVETQGEAEPLG